MTVIVRRLSCWLLLVLSAFSAHASEGMYPHDGAVVITETALLHDTSQTLMISDVAAPAFARRFVAQPGLSGKMVGYTRDALWIRISLANTGAETREIYLEAGAPRLRDVRLYDQHGDNAWRERRSGLQVPVGERDVHSRYPVFPVTLAPGEQRQLYLRVASGNAIALTVRNWSPAQFYERQNRIDFFNGVQFGAVFLMAAYGFLLFLGTRDSTYLYFSLLLGFFGAYDASFYQYGHEYFWGEWPDWAMRSPGFFLCTISIACGLLLPHLLEVRERMPGWIPVFRLLIALASITGVLILMLDYSRVVQFANMLAIATIVLSLGVCVMAAWRGYKPARFILLAFLFFWITSFIRIGQILGFVPVETLADYAQSWSIIISGMLMATSLSLWVKASESDRLTVQRDILHSQVAAREQLEAQVQERTAQLREAKEKAEDAADAKSRFLAQLSHELRTPLHSVLGNTGLMLRETRPDEDQRRLSAVRRSGEHLLALIDDVLEFVRGDADALVLKPVPVRLHDFLHGVIDEMQPEARAQDIRLLLQCDAGLPDGVELDGVRLRQVLLNLIGNGCRHSQGSVVAVHVSSLALNATTVQLCFVVQDDGQGIDEADLPQLFDPFWQAKTTGRGRGLGLGLPISRQWVRRMGGDLVYERNSAGGGLFRFCLPVTVSVLPADATAIAAEKGLVNPPPDSPGVIRTHDLRRPSPEALARLRLAAGLGLVTDIQEWASEVGQAEPQAAAFVEAVRTAVNRVDLPAVRRLAGE